MNRRSSPVGVIAGTGVAEHFEAAGRRIVKTEYGAASVSPSRDGSYYVLARHGRGNAVPPHRINNRANISCLRRLGVAKVIATCAVGSMTPRFGVGQIGLIGQFLDFTKGRPGTFFEKTARHTDMTNPYSARLNDAVALAGRKLGLKITAGLVYVCVEGPRFETAAEIRMYRRLGGDVVGMTGVPEVVLANEAGMEYCSVALATNWAAGIQEKVSHEEVMAGMKRRGPDMKSLIVAAVSLLREE